MIGIAAVIAKEESDREWMVNLFATAFSVFLLANYTIVVFALKNFF